MVVYNPAQQANMLITQANTQISQGYDRQQVMTNLDTAYNNYRLQQQAQQQGISYLTPQERTSLGMTGTAQIQTQPIWQQNPTQMLTRQMPVQEKVTIQKESPYVTAYNVYAPMAEKVKVKFAEVGKNYSDWGKVGLGAVGSSVNYLSNREDVNQKLKLNVNQYNNSEQEIKNLQKMKESYMDKYSEAVDKGGLYDPRAIEYDYQIRQADEVIKELRTPGTGKMVNVRGQDVDFRPVKFDNWYNSWMNYATPGVGVVLGVGKGAVQTFEKGTATLAAIRSGDIDKSKFNLGQKVSYVGLEVISKPGEWAGLGLEKTGQGLYQSGLFFQDLGAKEPAYLLKSVGLDLRQQGKSQRQSGIINTGKIVTDVGLAFSVPLKGAQLGVYAARAGTLFGAPVVSSTMPSTGESIAYMFQPEGYKQNELTNLETGAKIRAEARQYAKGKQAGWAKWTIANIPGLDVIGTYKRKDYEEYLRYKGRSEDQVGSDVILGYGRNIGAVGGRVIAEMNANFAGYQGIKNMAKNRVPVNTFTSSRNVFSAAVFEIVPSMQVEAVTDRRVLTGDEMAKTYGFGLLTSVGFEGLRSNLQTRALLSKAKDVTTTRSYKSMQKVETFGNWVLDPYEPLGDWFSSKITKGTDNLKFIKSRPGLAFISGQVSLTPTKDNVNARVAASTPEQIFIEDKTGGKSKVSKPKGASFNTFFGFKIGSKTNINPNVGVYEYIERPKERNSTRSTIDSRENIRENINERIIEDLRSNISINSTINIDTRIDERVPVNVQATVPVDTRVPVDVPVNINVFTPQARGGIPPLFPMGLGGSGRGGSKRGSAAKKFNLVGIYIGGGKSNTNALSFL